jgi:hypothetical protein
MANMYRNSKDDDEKKPLEDKWFFWDDKRGGPGNQLWITVACVSAFIIIIMVVVAFIVWQSRIKVGGGKNEKLNVESFTHVNKGAEDPALFQKSKGTFPPYNPANFGGNKRSNRNQYSSSSSSSSSSKNVITNNEGFPQVNMSKLEHVPTDFEALNIEHDPKGKGRARENTELNTEQNTEL